MNVLIVIWIYHGVKLIKLIIYVLSEKLKRHIVHTTYSQVIMNLLIDSVSGMSPNKKSSQTGTSPAHVCTSHVTLATRQRVEINSWKCSLFDDVLPAGATPYVQSPRNSIFTKNISLPLPIFTPVLIRMLRVAQWLFESFDELLQNSRIFYGQFSANFGQIKDTTW